MFQIDQEDYLERFSYEIIFKSPRVSKDINNGEEVLLLAECEEGCGRVCG